LNLLSKRAELTPQREALLEVESGRRHTYAQLNERANRCANWLRSYGVGYGDRISLLAHNSVVYLDLFFACGKIGAIFTPLNWRLAVPELAYIANHCTPERILFGEAFAETAQALRAQTEIAYWVPLARYEEVLARQAAEEPPRPPQLDGESAHCILYTSGTTGRPKGAIIPQRQVLWNCINTVVSWGLTEHDVSPVFTPLFHAGGLFAFLTPLFYAGGRIILARGFDAEASLHVIEEEGCTVILGVPTLFQMWRNAAAYKKVDFGNVHFFISGGAPCPPQLMEKWRAEKGIVFRQGYGLTEVGPNCFSMTDEESVPKTGAVGKPIFHSEMKLVDEAGKELPAGAVGELLIKGPHVCAGYWRDAAATAAAIADGWFHTGDMARRDEDGFYTIVGRLKDMIISGGENVYAAEVEAIVRQHPAVAEAALVGKPDTKWGEVGLVIAVAEDGSEVTEAEVIDFCRERLAPYKVPKEIIFVGQLPTSPYGKVEKVKLKERYVEQVAG
jgi:fatty-acyl-CoA synthase